MQRPIPIWFGARQPIALRRAGQLADGWFPQVPPGPRLEEALSEVRAGAESAGRDPNGIGMEGGVSLNRSADAAAEHLERWRGSGATHVGVNPMGCRSSTSDADLVAGGASHQDPRDHDINADNSDSS